MSRDASREQWTEVQNTRAWEDDHGGTCYVLRCGSEVSFHFPIIRALCRRFAFTNDLEMEFGVAHKHASRLMTHNEIYSVEFFALQLRFAAKVAEFAGLPFSETVGSHTNIYVRLGMGPRLDLANPDWIEYVRTLATSSDRAAWTHQIHCRRAHLPCGPTLVASVGCFSYALVEPGRVRLHFHTGSQLSDSPLSLVNEGLRKRELIALLSQLAESDEDVQVVGVSWLYNLAAYRRLFPEPYLCHLRPIAHPYQRMPLWGQFLNRHRSVRTGAVQHFDSCLAQATSLADLSLCFPFKVLTASLPVKRLLRQEPLIELPRGDA